LRKTNESSWSNGDVDGSRQLEKKKLAEVAAMATLVTRTRAHQSTAKQWAVAHGSTRAEYILGFIAPAPPLLVLPRTHTYICAPPLSLRTFSLVWYVPHRPSFLLAAYAPCINPQFSVDTT
jgi:hypothetical protein